MIAFLEPRSIEAAVAALDAYGDEARPVAGATALTILLRNGLIHPPALVSLGRIPDLSAIECDDGAVRFGALVTHRQLETSALTQQLLPSLAETFGVVANVRVRNAATVGGVLAEADYASDPPAALLALDASVDVSGPAGQRSIPIGGFFRGFYETALEPTEIIHHLRVPIPASGTHAVYKKYVTRSSEDRPCIGVFAAVRLAKNHRCAELRVAVGAVAEVPQRFAEVESLARDQSLDDDEVLRAISDGYAERIDTLSDLRGSAWYRTEMIRVWVRRAIEHAYRTAGGGA